MRNWNILGIILAVLTTAFPVYGQTPKTVGQLDTQNDVIRNETVPGANTRARIADMNKSIYLSSPNLFGTYAYPQSWLTGYQPTLVSATNIKTINSTSLLGSGDIVISSGVTSSAANNEFPISNGTNLVGSGFTYTGLFLSIPSGVLKINGNFSVGTFNVTQARRFESEQNSSNANDILYPVRISSTASVTPSVGKGVGYESQVQTGAGNVYKIGATDDVVSTNVGTGTESFDRVFKTMTNGAAATEKLRISGNTLSIGNPSAAAALTVISVAGSSNADMYITPAGTGAVNLQSSTVNLGLNNSGGQRTINAAGSATNIDAQFFAKGTGILRIGSNSYTEAFSGFQTNNVPSTNLQIRASPSSIPSIGFGSRLNFSINTNFGANYEDAAQIDVISTDLTSTSEDFDLVFKNMAAGATADEKLRIKSTSEISSTINTTSTNSLVNSFTTTTQSSGTVASGFGVIDKIDLESSGGANKTAVQIEKYWSDATNGSESSSVLFKTQVNGTLTETFRISSAGISTNTTNFVKFATGSATLDFPNTTASNSNDLTITVTGAVVGEVCTCTPPNGSVVANSIYTCWVSASNTVTVRFSNLDILNAANPASNTFKAIVFKF